MITVEFAGDGTSYVSGADGEVVRSIDPSEIYTVKLAVCRHPLQTHSYRMFDMDKKDGNGTFNININDILGKEKFVAEVGWVTSRLLFVREDPE